MIELIISVLFAIAGIIAAGIAGVALGTLVGLLLYACGWDPNVKRKPRGPRNRNLWD